MGNWTAVLCIDNVIAFYNEGIEPVVVVVGLDNGNFVVVKGDKGGKATISY